MVKGKKKPATRGPRSEGTPAATRRAFSRLLARLRYWIVSVHPSLERPWRRRDPIHLTFDHKFDLIKFLGDISTLEVSPEEAFERLSAPAPPAVEEEEWSVISPSTPPPEID